MIFRRFFHAVCADRSWWVFFFWSPSAASKSPTPVYPLSYIAHLTANVVSCFHEEMTAGKCLYSELQESKESRSFGCAELPGRGIIVGIVAESRWISCLARKRALREVAPQRQFINRVLWTFLSRRRDTSPCMLGGTTRCFLRLKIERLAT